jgi:hypothetical protein
MASYRPPFKLHGRHASARVFDHNGNRVAGVRGFGTGRASYIWAWYVLVPLATGRASYVEFARSAPDGPWHRIEMTMDEAYAQLERGRPWTNSILRKVDQRRRRDECHRDKRAASHRL